MMIPKSFTAQVVEFEDLLRPNEAMALLEAARVTAERRLALGGQNTRGIGKIGFFPRESRKNCDFSAGKWKHKREGRKNHGKPRKI